MAQTKLLQVAHPKVKDGKWITLSGRMVYCPGEKCRQLRMTIPGMYPGPDEGSWTESHYCEKCNRLVMNVIHRD